MIYPRRIKCSFKISINLSVLACKHLPLVTCHCFTLPSWPTESIGIHGDKIHKQKEMNLYSIFVSFLKCLTEHVYIYIYVYILYINKFQNTLGTVRNCSLFNLVDGFNMFQPKPSQTYMHSSVVLNRSGKICNCLVIDC